MSVQFGVIGGGVMGEALLSRLLARKIYAPEAVVVSDPQPERRDYLQENYHVHVTGDNRQAVAASEALLLAVKPQVLDKVVSDLSPHGQGVGGSSLVLSILAGVPLKRLEPAFAGQPVIRVMPNTPSIVGAGMTALAPGQGVTEAQRELAKRIFASVGEVVEVSESLMDAVTGVSGSGPAYVALFIEALADGGVAAGLPRNVASQLALQTVLGTAQLLQDSGLHPGQLKDRVTSPGGTTIAGVATLEKLGFRSATLEAVKAAYQRSQELGRDS
ncbi:pyrroline-5-carboxylate reductase [Spirulina sp. CS-785/01]|uniref:pyrroline-5-carboxylate reductase n=1 Tax=Spirulina sp. CS-785/01 TaxID=3021716 RepID=UPI00232E9B9D|nr:pyrroline-5-carboxylate reductase [Spirulina sp. CS-785/01]MDB9314386.1 pyrroline-5-carboxylate reductase [Spirulina sp. CS-785/01]